MKMNNLPTNIFIATEKDYPELSELWEASVRSTHHFLSEEDIPVSYTHLTLPTKLEV